MYHTNRVVIRYYRKTSRLRALYDGTIHNTAQLEGILDALGARDPLEEPEPTLVPPSPLAPELPSPSEYLVASILCHFGSRKARRYRVLWANGEETVEPRECLVDIIDGEEVVNEKLLLYLQSQ